MPLDQLLKVCCPSLSDSRRNTFTLHPLLPFGHLQTLYASLYADYISNQTVEYDREYLKTADGGTISIDWAKSTKTVDVTSKIPYLFILHGLTGGSHETYVQDLIVEVEKYGYRSVVMNFRGCSNTPVTSAQLYSGAFTGDVKLCIEHVIRKVPNSVLFGVGFSLGSSILTKFCGQMGDNSPLVGMVSIGNPYDFLGSLRALERSFIGRNLYSKHMGRNLSRIFFRHENVFRNCEWLDMKEVANAKSIMEFDAAATAKSFGFKTVHEYYRFGSSAQDIPYITTPCLFLTALDDPISNSEVIPYYEIKSNPNAILATTKTGGHLGWFSYNGSFIPGTRWFQKPVSEFIHAIMESQLSLPPGAIKRKTVEVTGTPWFSLPHNVLSARKKLADMTWTKERQQMDNSCQTDQIDLPLNISQGSSSQIAPEVKSKVNSSSSIVARKTLLCDYLRGSKWSMLFFILAFLLKRKFREN